MPMHNVAAHEEYEQVRVKAFWNALIHWITGKNNQLLPFDEVRKHLVFEGQHYLGLQSVPVDKIIGSVGRYRDFDRAFLPTQRQTQYRWENIHAAHADGVVLPPVDLYKIGEVYFVKDGNHRVSVARINGQDYMDAYVTAIKTPLPVTQDTDIDILIQQQERQAFLAQTRLHEICPDISVALSAPGQYVNLLEHIAVHRWYMGQAQQHEIPYPEAVASWVDNVYLPLVQLIREQDILKHFPNRTEADLYLWISEHRAELETELGAPVAAESAAEDLAEHFSAQPGRVAERLGKKLLHSVLPEELESGPAPGKWRQERLKTRSAERYFVDVLVALNGTESGWMALEHALEIAQREQSFLRGLHSLPNTAHYELPEVQAMQTRFAQRCAEAGISGEFSLEVGEPIERICAHARRADVVVVSLTYPPPTQPLARLGSGFRNLVQRITRPLLAIPPDTHPPLTHPLLAYDGSPAADEALFITGHLATVWQLPVTLITASETAAARATARTRALCYLQEYGATVTAIDKAGAPGPAILQTAEEQGCDGIIMGSYGQAPLLQVVLGSTVDHVLRHAHLPILICR